MTCRQDCVYTCAMLTRRIPSIRSVVLLICTLLPLGVAHADWLVLQRVTDADGSTRPAYSWVGSSRFRYDDGRIAVIADLEAGRVHLLDHAHKTRTTRHLATSAAPPLRAFTPEGGGRFQDWAFNRYVLVKDRNLIEVGTSTDVDATLTRHYRAMLSAIGAGADNRILELPGFPLWTTLRDRDTGELLGRRETVSIVKRTAYPATYRIPGEYRTIDPE